MMKPNRRSFVSLLGSAASLFACKGVGVGRSATKASKEEAEFDYIVVGSGAGGGPLAVNLAKAGFRTLLLEAGSDQGKRAVYQVPAFHPKSTEDSEMAWDFYVDHFSKAADNKADAKYVPNEGILYPRAGTLGGCTAHNAMITIYPLKKDWDQLAKDVGDASYQSGIMRKYFQLCENAEYQEQPERKQGWLPVNIPKAASSPLQLLNNKVLAALVFAAWRKFRRESNENVSSIESLLNLLRKDANADNPDRDREEGLVMIPTATTSEGKRFSTRDLIMKNLGKNLNLRTSCLVTKVLFDDSQEEPEAIGVEYVVGDRTYQASKNPNPASKYRTQVYAKYEVILAGGAFNSPQLLMASGIGPKADLERFLPDNPDYKILVDRPGVGANLQDRYEVGVVSEAKENFPILETCRFEANESDPCYADWLQGNGPYTSSGGVIGMFKKSKPSLESADLFMFLLPTDFHGYFPGYSDIAISAKNRFTWAILKSHTQNRGGRVRLKDLDPTSRPIINFHYYEDGTDANGRPLNGDKSLAIEDLEAVVTGIEFVRAINASAGTTLDIFDVSAELPEGPAGFEDRFLDETTPGSSYSRRDKLREWVRRNSWGHHACGTCKMGREDDPHAVVNSKFQVIGTKSLRVVDASVFPRIPGYFIASSIYAMSERASDEVLASRGLPRRVNFSET